MALMGLLRGDAIKGLLHLFSTVGEFVAKRRPHLEDTVGEPELEDRPGDRWIRALVPEIEMLPRLRAPRFVVHDLQRFWILGGVDHGTPGTDDSEEPGVGFARSNPFCMHRDGELVIILIDLAIDGCVIPRPAGDKTAFAIGTFLDDFAKLSANPRWEPAES